MKQDYCLVTVVLYHVRIKLEFHVQHAIPCQLICKFIITLFPLSLGNSLLHSPMLDLDSDVRSSPIGHLSQTASLKRGSSFQSGRDDGRYLFYLEKSKLQFPMSSLWYSQETQTETHILCGFFGFLPNKILSSHALPLLTKGVLCVFLQAKSIS